MMASFKTPLAMIVHPTDVAAAGTLAFAHALDLALTAKSQLCLLHVRGESDAPPGKSAPASWISWRIILAISWCSPPMPIRA